jgi:hypothetical protein
VNTLPPRSPTGASDWGDYSFCGQLIRWGDGDYQIRPAYYRRRAGEDHWEYASQMTVSGYWETMKALIERTLDQKCWFSEDPVLAALDKWWESLGRSLGWR